MNTIYRICLRLCLHKNLIQIKNYIYKPQIQNYIQKYYIQNKRVKSCSFVMTDTMLKKVLKKLHADSEDMLEDEEKTLKPNEKRIIDGIVVPGKRLPAGENQLQQKVFLKDRKLTNVMREALLNGEIKPEPDLKLTWENHQNIMERFLDHEQAINEAKAETFDVYDLKIKIVNGFLTAEVPQSTAQFLNNNSYLVIAEEGGKMYGGYIHNIVKNSIIIGVNDMLITKIESGEKEEKAKTYNLYCITDRKTRNQASRAVDDMNKSVEGLRILFPKSSMITDFSPDLNIKLKNKSINNNQEQLKSVQMAVAMPGKSAPVRT